ncbi:FAD-linked oxidase C-terminal domain-containing protein [Corallococcus exiguus]|uniref:FAD-linked oxidase C-terminal domain-containing protein n=1 Tax=Corallococcus exiguus TaxID=83462 RepID=UPI00155FE0D1|nr:FAD-linked oxidase C-terminal domain-containing protein [Corallococcus exiguus]NRD47215.1 hypothetical protein [Corallococcus exiguus]
MVAKGQGFQLLFDEGDVEFWTDAFEEPSEGRTQLIETLRLHQAIKGALDPLGLLNPGKVL